MKRIIQELALQGSKLRDKTSLLCTLSLLFGLCVAYCGIIPCMNLHESFPSPPLMKLICSTYLLTRFAVLRQGLWKFTSEEERLIADPKITSETHLDTATSDVDLLTNSYMDLSGESKTHARPTPIRQQSLPKFTSNPTPRTTIALEETTGPSIMFVGTPSPLAARKADPITSASTESSLPRSTSPLPDNTVPQALGHPLHQSIPLSFNDLPCRAQHLILNELIKQHSYNAAVVFTTLPSLVPVRFVPSKL